MSIRFFPPSSSPIDSNSHSIYIKVNNACLGELVFEPVAPAITIVGVYLVFLIDFYVMRWLKKRAANRAAASAADNCDDPTPSPGTSM